MCPGGGGGSCIAPDSTSASTATALPSVTLVSAPAGFGKTTLLAEWLAGGRGRAGAHGMAVARPARQRPVGVLVLRRRRPPPGRTRGRRRARSPRCSRRRRVRGRRRHARSTTSPASTTTSSWCSTTTTSSSRSTCTSRCCSWSSTCRAQLHLVVASRADPPWPLAGLRARGELLEVRAADLRFTADEAAAYLNDAMGLDLTAADIDALEGRTEGWIAALQLAALSLQGRDDPAAFIAGFAGDDRFVVDYLVDEVLNRQPDDVRTFLLETSILSRLTASLCAAVTGRSDAKATLETLERSNLFVVAARRPAAVVPVPPPVRRRAARPPRRRAPRPVAELHRRASDWFDADGDRPEAIRHAVAAEDFRRAAELVELAIPGLRQARQDATQRAWLDALPPEVFAQPPRAQPRARRRPHGHRRHRRRRCAPRRASKAGSTPIARRPTWSCTTTPSSAGCRPRPPCTAPASRCCAAISPRRSPTASGQLDLSAADDHLGRGAAAALIGLARWADGDLEAAARQYTAAIAAFEAAGYLADILGCSLGLADIQVAQGRLGARANAP